MDFQSWMTAVQQRTERSLESLLPASDIAPQRLHQAMRYATLGGGKRIRPLLCHAAGELAGADSARLDIAGCAVELIHAYSLVHDDLPCMDNDVLRRGKPTCHVEYDEATAMLVGDALQAQAFLLLSDHVLADDPLRQLEMLRLLAQAAGSRGMAGGQMIDIEGTGQILTRAELEFMHVHKTGALIRAAILLGAQCGTPMPEGEIARLDHFAKRVGLLFQVIDDILDAEASTATLGKTAGKDAAQGKVTYVSAMGLAEAREMADSLRSEAREAIEAFGERGRRLHELAHFIVTRKF
ncbi:MAG: polyprenyl synthetase family protein [Rhodocyclaceae bacterium]|nr:polyprenyl synthetase family protein [Rhodocyclaceae bacterium]MCB1891532.1 polyprenyl synthetase family protein [Rhodocyclaceae bacterium]PKO72670.1 MAG: geranyl transferase [Betaproteobacteria bacterium HGW-Betaproteobacteria-14]